MISKKQLNMYLLDLEQLSQEYITDESPNVRSFMWTRLNGALCAGAELGVFKYYPKGFLSCMSDDIYYLCDGDWKVRVLLERLRKKYTSFEGDKDEYIILLMNRVHEDLLQNMTDEAKQVLEGEE